MSNYLAPLRDILFTYHETLGIPEQLKRLPRYQETDLALIEAILDEGSRFFQEVVSPLNSIGDQQGSRLVDGEVVTPDGFKEAYEKLVEGGWPSLTGDPELGGQGLPESIGVPLAEMSMAADLSWSMFSGISHSAISAIQAHGDDSLVQRFLPKMFSGEWTGTMCLTEPHCGSDLGLLRTAAEPLGDGRFAISGTKIFITGGDHSLADNIIHLVLARLPDAPAGTKGISLMLVPKFNLLGDDSLGERNGVTCESLEHKMGIKASPTCVLNFERAEGFLVGEENRGLAAMFTMMNEARLYVGCQGLGLMEAAYQKAREYAKERLQMRSLSGPKQPQKPADPIIVHPDVRRMLLTQKALLEGARALCCFAAQFVDQRHGEASQEEAERADALLGIITPICKAFVTESAIEATSHAVQVFGGHGYVHETGVEQLYRDARITTIYEGTTGIQALDLLGRKVLMNRGENLGLLVAMIKEQCVDEHSAAAFPDWCKRLSEAVDKWVALTGSVGAKAVANADEVGAASVDYLMYSGHMLLGYLWLRMADTAQQAIDSGSSEVNYYKSKIATARFYYERLFSRTYTLAANIEAGAAGLMEMDAAQF